MHFRSLRNTPTPWVLLDQKTLAPYRVVLRAPPATRCSQVLLDTRVDDLQRTRQGLLYDDAVKWCEGIVRCWNTMQAACVFLERQDCIKRVYDRPYYLYFARLCWHYLNQNSSTAQANIEAVFSQFVSRGYSSEIMRALASLQGITIP